MVKSSSLLLGIVLLACTIAPNIIFTQVSGFHIPGDPPHSGCVPAPGMPCNLPGGGDSPDPEDVRRAVDELNTAAVAILGVLVLGTTAVLIKKAVSGKSKPIYDTTPHHRPPDGAVRISGDTPKLFEKPKTPFRPWVDVPLPDILPDPPKSPIDLAEEMSKKLQTFSESELSKYFEDVGNCIIKNNAALHTTKLMKQKFGKITVSKIKGVGGFLDYSDAEGVHTITTEELGRKLAGDLAKTYAKDIGEKAIGVFGKPLSPVGILTFLLSNFGEEITTPYICMAIHLKDR